jgi:hypothetical protein
MNKQELINKLTFIASEEDDSDFYSVKRKEAEDNIKLEKKKSNWEQVYNGGDWFVYKNNNYYIIHDCGVRTLYKEIPLEQLKLNLP